MMKKTLLSIMTMAALVSSATATAETKDIMVNAEIPSVMNMTTMGGIPLGYVELTPDINNLNIYGTKEKVVIDSNDQDIKINLVEDLRLTSRLGKGFSDVKVVMNGKELSTTTHNIIRNRGTYPHELVISAKKPSNSQAGERYSGVLLLNLEPDA